LLTTYLHELKVKVQRKRGEYRNNSLEMDGFEMKLMINKYVNDDRGHAVAQWVEAMRYKPEDRRFPMASMEFFIDTTLPASLWP
jgi:hypothetical protein